MKIEDLVPGANLQLIKLYGREQLIEACKRLGSIVSNTEKIADARGLISYYHHALLDGTIRCLPPIDITRVYNRLVDIDDRHLDHVSEVFGMHLGLRPVPMVFRRDLVTAGRLRERTTSQLFVKLVSREIEISVRFAHDIKALAAIVAHEYTHVYRREHKLSSDSGAKEELATDMYSIILGFDELILQGISSLHPVGYLSPGVVGRFCEIVDSVRMR